MQNLRDASFSINKVITKYNMLNNITKTSCVIINILISEISKYLNTKNIINSNIKNTTKMKNGYYRFKEVL